MSPEPAAETTSTEVYYEVAAKALDAQMVQVDQLDTKISIAYTAATSVLAAFAALLALAALPKSGWVHAAVLSCFGVACGLYIVAAICLVVAYQVGKWAFGPKLSKVKEYSERYQAIGVQAWLANVYAVSIQKNDAKINAKSCWFNAGIYVLAAESVVLVAAVAISLFFI